MVLFPAALGQAAADVAPTAQQAQQLQEAGNYAAAAGAYRAHLQLHSDDADARSNLAACLARLGRYQEAFDEYQKSGDYPAAVKEFGRAVEAHPQLPGLHSYYGLALLYTGDPTAAAAAFHRELAVNPNDYAANLALGQILIASKQYQEAEPFVRAAPSPPLH